MCIRDSDGGERSVALASIFATKEAFYKAHYAIDPRYLAFDAISVTVSADGQVGCTPDSGVVDQEILARTSGRVHVDARRAVAAVTIDRSDLPLPLPSAT